MDDDWYDDWNLDEAVGDEPPTPPEQLLVRAIVFIIGLGN
jgi:hypothetical protein